METDEASHDLFSSFTIHKFNSQTENIVISNEVSPHQKLKPRRKSKKAIENDASASSSRFKLKVKYDGYFKPINNGTKMKYCFGRQKTIYLVEPSYGFVDLVEDVSALCPLDEDFKLSLSYLDKCSSTQSFIQLEDDDSYGLMLTMYEEKKEVVVYMTKEKIMFHDDGDIGEDENIEFTNYEEWSDYCHSEESYHSRDNNTEDDDESDYGYEGEFYSYDKDDPKIEVGAKFPHVVAFRRALNHYAVINDFEYNLGKSEPTRVTATCANLECSWRIYAAVAQDKVTFVVRTMQSKHTCCGVNRRGNKHATKGWIADRIVNDLKKKGDISTKELKEKIETKFGIILPYDRVWEGKELAIQEIYGRWSDSFDKIGELKNELLKRYPGSVVEFTTEPEDGPSRHFQRFFVALGACTSGFLKGCRPYIGLDACHLKGKWKGVVAAATAMDGNNWMFPVAFAVMEGENEDSWEWFLRALYKAIEMPHGLVISSDMQKGLQNALAKIYPLAEHRECMRHLFSNFKKHYQGDLFKFGLWGAARTYSPTRFDALINEMKTQCPTGIEYLNKEHNNLWSRSKFGTVAKCDSLTNNISETFNAWISDERQKPVIDLLDSIRQKIMLKFDRRRRIATTWKGTLVPKVADYIKNISRSLGEYEVHRSMDFCAEVQKNELRWEVKLEERTCTCRAWQVKGTPCIHAAAFIASLRNARWENYVDSYFTVSRFKAAYAVGIAPMSSKNDWMNVELGFKIFPPILKRPAGRPRKNRIRPSDEPNKRSHKCTRCGLYGHHRSTCKNPVVSHGGGSVDVQMTQESIAKRGKNESRKRSKKRACPPTIFKLMEEENI